MDVSHDDVIKWTHFPRYWPFVRGIHRSPVNFPHKGQWHGALMFSLNCARINGWVNNREAGDLRRIRAHYDVIVMYFFIPLSQCLISKFVICNFSLKWVDYSHMQKKEDQEMVKGEHDTHLWHYLPYSVSCAINESCSPDVTYVLAQTASNGKWEVSRKMEEALRYFHTIYFIYHVRVAHVILSTNLCHQKSYIFKIILLVRQCYNFTYTSHSRHIFIWKTAVLSVRERKHNIWVNDMTIWTATSQGSLFTNMGKLFSFSNFKDADVEVCEWTSNFIPHFLMGVLTYPYWG